MNSLQKCNLQCEKQELFNQSLPGAPSDCMKTQEEINNGVNKIHSLNILQQFDTKL